MNTPVTNLAIPDPLAPKEITVTVVSPPGPRGAREALVSVGMLDSLPLFKAGPFADIQEMIYELWAALEKRKTAPAPGSAVANAPGETIAAAEVAGNQSAPPTTPKPQHNLSLF